MMYAQNSLAINEFLADRWKKVRDVFIEYTSHIFFFIICLLNNLLLSNGTALQWELGS